MSLRPLKPGDTIAFVTPASPISQERLEFVTSILEEEGFSTHLMPHALERDEYLAGSDRDRAQDLQEAFEDPTIAAVVCTRGGYGCARLFPYLDLDAIAKSRKPFFGFSDITTLHVALNRRGMPTIHSPMPLTLSYPRAPWVISSFRRVLRNDLTIIHDAPPPTTIVRGKAVGQLVGGCLSLITDSIGTPDAIDATGKILLIEEVDQAPHRIDAMLTHLINSGIAESAAGFLVGEMTRTDERVDEGIGGKPWRTIVRDRLQPLGKPMVMDFPHGHAPNMLTLPLGILAELDADAGTLTYRESLWS
jgi:muramoyltetrapeptide carboxypeptidase